MRTHVPQINNLVISQILRGLQLQQEQNYLAAEKDGAPSDEGCWFTARTPALNTSMLILRFYVSDEIAKRQVFDVESVFSAIGARRPRYCVTLNELLPANTHIEVLPNVMGRNIS